MFSLQTMFGRGNQFYSLLEEAAQAAHDAATALHKMLRESDRAPALDAFKLARVRERIDASGRDVLLEIDGGVKPDNIGEIAKAGADAFVAGSAIFGKPDYAAVIAEMRSEIGKATR